MTARLDEFQITQALEELPEWRVSAGEGEDARQSLHRRLVFADFVTAFAFMTAVAIEAEKLDHHPDWSNVYHSVDINLTTHDAGGLTLRDLELAREIDRHAARLLG